MAALLLVAHPTRSDFTAGITSGGDLNRWRAIGDLTHEGHKLPYALHEQLDSLPAMDELLKGVSVPVLMAHGEKDHLFPAEDIKSLFDGITAEPKDLLVEPEADHRFGKDLWRIHLLDRTRAFLDRIL